MGAGLALLITSVAFDQRADALFEQQKHHYGEALARMTAQQAVDAALNHDLVSLQVVLQDVSANPGVVLATIHDVENNLLVQAGDTVAARRAETPLKAHTAPITLHDSIAGYVTVTIATSGEPLAAIGYATLATTAGLALLCLYLAYRYRQSVFIRTERSTASLEENEAPMEEAASEDLAATARVQIGIGRWEDLQQQLNAEVFHSVTRDFDRLLDHVLALYGGEQVEKTSGGELRLRFDSSESATDAAFRASCGAWLLQQLSDRLAAFPLRLGVIVFIHDEIELAPPPGLWLDPSAVELTQLSERLSAEQEGHRYRLTGFRQPYAALLERQLRQLEQVRA